MRWMCPTSCQVLDCQVTSTDILSLPSFLPFSLPSFLPSFLPSPSTILPSFFPPSLLSFLPSFLFFLFLGLPPRHMEVPRLGVALELWLPAYSTATATPDPSCICDLHHSFWQL